MVHELWGGTPQKILDFNGRVYKSRLTWFGPEKGLVPRLVPMRHPLLAVAPVLQCWFHLNQAHRDVPRRTIEKSNTFLVGGWAEPLWKIWTSIGMIIATQYFWENSKFMATSHHQPENEILIELQTTLHGFLFRLDLALLLRLSGLLATGLEQAEVNTVFRARVINKRKQKKKQQTIVCFFQIWALILNSMVCQCLWCLWFLSCIRSKNGNAGGVLQCACHFASPQHPIQHTSHFCLHVTDGLNLELTSIWVIYRNDSQACSRTNLWDIFSCG